MDVIGWLFEGDPAIRWTIDVREGPAGGPQDERPRGLDAVFPPDVLALRHPSGGTDVAEEFRRPAC